MSKYEHVNTQTKQTVNDLFRHLLTVLDNNFSTTKQEAIYIENKKQSLLDKEDAFKNELEKVSTEANKKLLDIEANHKQIILKLQESKAEIIDKSIELQSKNDELIRELKSISSVADQVKNVMAENKEHREQIKCDADSHKIELQREKDKYHTDIDAGMDNMKAIQRETENLKKEIFENSLNLNQANKQVTELKEYASSQSKELEETKAALNKALGKLEVLEKIEEEE
ncbi:MAG TPA: hypothetical protein EYH42_04480 [Sulfurovum sp.]|nr:hypothetical protein [Sulfurovum sp.]